MKESLNNVERLCDACAQKLMSRVSRSVAISSNWNCNSYHQKELFVCGNCGYQRLASIETLQDAINLQSHFSMSTPQRPSIEEVAWPHRPALIARTIRRLSPSGRSILDVGCNTGLNLRALDNRWDKYGVELSQKLAEVAREFANAEVFCGLIEEFSPNEQKFDVVTAHAVIEHVYDPADLLRRMISLTQPGGLIMLMTGDRESNAAKMLGPSWPLYISNDHVSFFSARSLRALARRLGLTVIHEEWRYMHLPKERQTLFRRTIEKTREILGFLDYPTNDIYHLYARSPA